MLTDIFAERYLSRPLWPAFTDAESKLLVQCFRLISEQVFPRPTIGPGSVPMPNWQTVHDRLSMELGREQLTPVPYAAAFGIDMACRSFMLEEYTHAVSADRFMKERISFVELAFRTREEGLAAQNRELPIRLAAGKAKRLGKTHDDKIAEVWADNYVAIIEKENASFRASVDELNERFRRAGAPLNYHNGFIQVAADPLVQGQIEKPFWQVVADPIWKNVDTDMKEALDRRDSGDRDPAFYAARALESTIKIISDKKGWTHGGEKGAHNYVDNLGSKSNGPFIVDWERDALKSFFTDIRNPLGHGPGAAQMPQLTPQQTNFAIETCMSWIRSLVQRS
jgi:hypothetical protein